jgi:hypothetical protein
VARVEAAAARAVAVRAYSARSVASILKKNLDQQPLLESEETAAEQFSLVTRQHQNVHGPQYYQ